MEVGGIYSGTTDSGIRQVNEAMRKTVDANIDEMKKSTAVAVQQQVQTKQQEYKDKALGQIVDVKA